MAKITKISTYDETNEQWRTPTDIGVKAENVDIDLTNGTNDLQSALGAYNDSTTITSKLKNIGANSTVDAATISAVAASGSDTSKVITGDNAVDVVSNDTVKSFAEKYNKRGLRINNKFADYFLKSNVVTSLSGTSTTTTVPSAKTVYDAIQLPELLPNSAAAHRSIYRGINLIGSNAPFASISALVTQVRASNFKNIFVGDYFDITLPATSLSNAQTVRLIVMDINYYKNCGDTQFTAPHLILVPKDALANTAKMNNSDTTSNGYVNSVMHTSTLPTYATAFKSALGSANVLTHRDLLTNAMDTNQRSTGYYGWGGAASNWAWYDVTLRLLSESMVYGAPILNSSMFDTGVANRQLAGFALNPELLVKMLGYGSTSRANWWLSGVVLSTSFALVSIGGLADGYGASYAFGVVPLIVFG